MVFQTPFRDGHPTLGGVYASFLTLYDSEGRALPFTYGLVPRAAMKTDIDHELPYGLWPEYPLEGFVFNRWDVCDPNHPLIALDNRHGALAVAKGKELFVPGALSPAYPEVRALWLSHLEECLDAGVDGIDLRDAQHNRALVWEDYGFEAPVLEEYRRRHGVEPVPANMDRDNQVAIVADFLTQYYRQASRLIRGRGKKVQMHVQPLSRRYMGIKWDWPTWVAEGLMDAITLKMAWPNDAAVLEKMRDAAARGIGLYSCPFMPYESRLQRDGGVLDQFGTMLQAARDGGVENGCILYETAHIVQMRPDGSIRVKLPKVIDTLRNWNR
jgi:uncharacterized lipoprotein YddW (UPF0748 family)